MMDRAALVRALDAARAYRDGALEALRARLAERKIDEEQRAAHGFAWVATSVAALEATLGWLERNGDANPVDAKVAQLGFAETLAQLIGGFEHAGFQSQHEG
jgi:(2S)-methylsuccinyl-CoA dehydrogenase